ncbi:hypothetical protein EDB83DRAFT_2319767 [Lactarius deliciosus]|nr:hypothetical protein EDB83DRAFT_2319767 [Lactarius deliciosus]
MASIASSSRSGKALKNLVILLATMHLSELYRVCFLCSADVNGIDSGKERTTYKQKQISTLGRARGPLYTSAGHPRRGAPRPRDPNTAPTPVDSRTRDKPLPLQPPLPFARKGRGAQERGVRDRPPANEGSARGDESRRAPTPLPRSPLYARAVREHGRALQVGVRPPLPGFARTGNVRTGTHRSGAPSTTQSQTRTGGRTEAPPPLPPVRAPGQNANGRPRGSPPPSRRFARQGNTRTGSCVEAPPLSRGFARQGNTRTGSRAEAPLSRGFARQGNTRTGSRAEAPLSRGFARQGNARTGSRAEAPPLPRVRAPGQHANGQPRGSPPSPSGSRARAKRERATVQKPPPSPAGSRQGKTRTGGHAEAPPLPRVRAPGQNANGRSRGSPRPSRRFSAQGQNATAWPCGSASLRVCTPGARGSGGA